jgi:hypothetical protein
MIKVRYATLQDADFFYTERLMSFKAWVIEDKELLVIGGYLLHPEGNVMFVKCRDGAPKKTLWQISKKVVKEVSKIDLPIWAVRDEQVPTSKRYLERLGFKFLHIHNNEEIYLWHKR